IHLAENALKKCEQYQAVLQQLPVLSTTPRAKYHSSSSSDFELDSSSSSSESADDNIEKQPHNPAILHRYQHGVAANQIEEIDLAMATLDIDGDSNNKRIILK
ncbi:MAG TPA: hypothetical protein PLD88_11495, partial [Candidatus Berkiella sp.]|nr:hypothetical protein [Candidatus Berkiella sp.]